MIPLLQVLRMPFEEIISASVLMLIVLLVLLLIPAAVLSLLLSALTVLAVLLILIVLLIAGAFNVVCTVLYYGLATMRCQRAILISYVAASLLALLASVPIVSALGVLGAGMSYLLTMAFLCLLLCYSLYSNKQN